MLMLLRMLLMIMRRTLALAVKAAWGPEQLEYVSQAIFDVGKTVTRQKIVLKDEDEFTPRFEAVSQGREMPDGIGDVGSLCSIRLQVRPRSKLTQAIVCQPPLRYQGAVINVRCRNGLGEEDVGETKGAQQCF